IDKLTPFGHVLKCPYFHHKACIKLRTTFPVILFASNSKTQINILQLYNGLNALKIFLKEHIFDANYLQDDAAKQENNDIMSRNIYDYI
ncbi:11652_t:CDS:1, partial [Gigaspora margarita]